MKSVYLIMCVSFENNVRSEEIVIAFDRFNSATSVCDRLNLQCDQNVCSYYVKNLPVF